MVWLMVLVACGEVKSGPEEASGSILPVPECVGLFGEPNENTGVSTDVCGPELKVEPEWRARDWDRASLDRLRAWTLLDPPDPLESDPYERADPAPPTAGICSVEVVDADQRTYRLHTVDRESELAERGWYPTHGGACGACSSLEDLAVYAGVTDLTGPVRQCAFLGLAGDVLAVDACLMDLGFSAACARAWTWNALYTRERCFDVCLSLLTAPYLTPDGELNACLQCDEDESGPVFQAIAGRTRRNSGLATALCRPCDSVWRLGHEIADL